MVSSSGTFAEKEKMLKVNIHVWSQQVRMTFTETKIKKNQKDSNKQYKINKYYITS